MGAGTNCDDPSICNPSPCPADVDGDDVVGVDDLLEILGTWGQTGSLPGDVNGDGNLDIVFGHPNWHSERQSIQLLLGRGDGEFDLAVTHKQKWDVINELSERADKLNQDIKGLHEKMMHEVIATEEMQIGLKLILTGLTNNPVCKYMN